MITKLVDKVYSYQVLKQLPYSPPFSWEERLDLFKSDIRVNLVGNPLFSRIRDDDFSAFFDNDFFSTGWIVSVLLDAGLYGKGAPDIDQARLQLALQAIGAYTDKNEPNPNKTIIRTFWPQTYNKTNNLWFQMPINIKMLHLISN